MVITDGEAEAEAGRIPRSRQLRDADGDEGAALLEDGNAEVRARGMAGCRTGDACVYVAARLAAVVLVVSWGVGVYG